MRIKRVYLLLAVPVASVCAPGRSSSRLTWDHGGQPNNLTNRPLLLRPAVGCRRSLPTHLRDLPSRVLSFPSLLLLLLPPTSLLRASEGGCDSRRCLAPFYQVWPRARNLLFHREHDLNTHTHTHTHTQTHRTQQTHITQASTTKGMIRGLAHAQTSYTTSFGIHVIIRGVRRGAGGVGRNPCPRLMIQVCMYVNYSIVNECRCVNYLLVNQLATYVA